MRTINIKLFLVVAFGFTSCNSFKYGYTQRRAFNFYHLITSDPSNFGNRRIRYNMGHHKNTQLTCLLQTIGNPDFIFEYEDERKCDGINLYYLKKDSVYLFKEKKSSNPQSTAFVEARKIIDTEKVIYKNLLNQVSH